MMPNGAMVMQKPTFTIREPTRRVSGRARTRRSQQNGPNRHRNRARGSVGALAYLPDADPVPPLRFAVASTGTRAMVGSSRAGPVPIGRTARDSLHSVEIHESR